ncbi:hypothetical protein LCGC14_1482770 [marine sediment metagenome]|uniref:Uncharacterized protein n=1 Tax=marine sediment metagenome TaxID=412755 RepID=A0A0F9MAX4_9ZZZZ
MTLKKSKPRPNDPRPCGSGRKLRTATAAGKEA